MERETITLQVTVKLDPIPGAMHTKEDAIAFMEHALNVGVTSYYSDVKRAPVRDERGGEVSW